MGKLTRLKDSRSIYTGGLDRSHDLDGKWALFYEDDVLQVCFFGVC